MQNFMLRVLPKLFLVVSVLGLVMVGLGVKKVIDFNGAPTAQGTVVSVREEQAKEQSGPNKGRLKTVYRSEIEWTDPSGQTRTFWAEETSGAPAHTGDPITIEYLKDDPARAQVKSFSSTWTLVIVGSGFFLVFGLLGIALPKVLGGRVTPQSA